MIGDKIVVALEMSVGLWATPFYSRVIIPKIYVCLIGNGPLYLGCKVAHGKGCTMS